MCKELKKDSFLEDKKKLIAQSLLINFTFFYSYAHFLMMYFFFFFRKSYKIHLLKNDLFIFRKSEKIENIFVIKKCAKIYEMNDFKKVMHKRMHKKYFLKKIKKDFKNVLFR